jgi:hypothetical protein
MNFTGLGADRCRLKLRIMSDGDLWWLFLNHREECLRSSGEKWKLEKRLVSYPRTVHSGRWANSQGTVNCEAPVAIPT